ncbi:hypothetical protein JCM3775_006419 [Rhodotorula graminis]
MDNLAAMFTQLSTAMGNPNPDLSYLERVAGEMGGPDVFLGAMAQMAASLQDYTDPLDDPEFANQITTARKVHAAEKARKPRRPPVADRDELVDRIEQQRAMIARERLSGQPWIYLGMDKGSSPAPLGQLQPILLKDMLATKTHKGRYLLCRIISKTALTSSVAFIVEDQEARVETVSIFNLDMCGVPLGDGADPLFGVGDILAIREPTYRTETRDTTKFAIRVDSPTDFHFLSPHDPLVEKAKWATTTPRTALPASFDYKALGNKYFGENLDLYAVKAYSDGILKTQDPAQHVVLLLNRAMARLRVGAFVSACRDTTDALTLLSDGIKGPSRAVEKAMLRRAKALEGARLLTRACEEYRRIGLFDPDSTEAAERGKRRVEGMLKASRTGKYEWMTLAMDGPRDQRTVCGVSVGDYVGPIEVAQIKGRGGGRGIVATRDIKVGELLLVEKAYVIGEEAASKGYNLKTDLLLSKPRVALIAALAAKVQDDPASADLLYALYAGPDYPPLGAATLGGYRDRELDLDDRTPPFADIERIERIATYSGVATREDLNFSASPTAVYLSGSLFNHACVSNATSRFAGDVQMVRARTAIPKGAEVLIAYVPYDAPEAFRQRVLQPHFPKGCPCDNCRRNAPGRAKRAKRHADLLGPSSQWHKARTVLADLESSELSRQDADQVFEKTVDLLERSYPPNHGPIKSALFTALLEQAGTCPGERSLELYDRAFAAVGAEFKRTPSRVEIVAMHACQEANVIQAMVFVAARHNLFGRRADARAWFKAAAELSEMAMGSSYDKFIEEHEDEIKVHGVRGLVESCRP